MKFRPCIDIHNGHVKQIVGGSLRDVGNVAVDNFVSDLDASFYAELYKRYGLSGGHIVLLNSRDSEFFEASRRQAFLALERFPMGLQVGGGITADNAQEFLEAGASHVIVTSYVFSDGKVDMQRLAKLSEKVGRDRLVLDLSCRKVLKDGRETFFIVTDRWQKFTDVELNADNILKLSEFCDEFLIHAVDVEGRVNGIESDLVRLLGDIDTIPMTYAGGIASFGDLEELKRLGRSKLDFTIGSALDLFGGNMKFEEVVLFS